MKHTPGPWKIAGSEIWAASRRITMGRGAYDEKDRATRDANARLIAEAPAMLEALIMRVKHILHEYPSAGVMSNMIGLEYGQLREIIERATGLPIEQVLKGESE